MKKLCTFLIIILFANLLTVGQAIKINGRLYDKGEGKIVANGVLFLNPGHRATASDLNGEYSFITTPGIKHIVVIVF